MLYTASWVITTDNHTSFLYDNNLVRGLLFCQAIFAKLNICQLFWFHRTHNNMSKENNSFFYKILCSNLFSPGSFLT